MLAHIHGLLIKEDVSRARRLAAGGTMAAEQSAVDGNWKTAWRLLGLQQPPRHEWASMDIGSVREEYSKFRLADTRWVAAVIADLKGEDFLGMREPAEALRKGSGKDRKDGGGV